VQIAPDIVGIKAEVNISNFLKKRVPKYLKEDFPNGRRDKMSQKLI